MPAHDLYLPRALLLFHGPLPRHILIIPTAWALVGSTAAIFFGLYEDITLLATALIAVALILRRKKI